MRLSVRLVLLAAVVCAAGCQDDLGDPFLPFKVDAAAPIPVARASVDAAVPDAAAASPDVSVAKADATVAPVQKDTAAPAKADTAVVVPPPPPPPVVDAAVDAKKPPGVCPDIDNNGILDCKETVVPNPGFDNAAEGWTDELGARHAASTVDAEGKTTSGSMSVTNQNLVVGASGNTMAGIRRCLPAVAGKTYRVSAFVFIDGTEGQGQAGVNVQFYSDSSCAGSPLGAATALGAERMTWAPVQTQGVSPATTASMVVRLVAVKPFSQQTFTVQIDDLLVKPL